MILLTERPLEITQNGIFHHAVSTIPSTQKTFVCLSHNQQNLIVDFDCRQDLYMEQNKYTKCNRPLYEQEVFEIFIAYGEKVPSKYLEIEINPNNALYVAKIFNPDYIGYKNIKTPVDCNKSGIQHTVQKNPENSSWQGKLEIPFSLIEKASEKSEIVGRFPAWRVNFFRIISKVSHQEKDWNNSLKESDYLCYNTTNSPELPKFHRTNYMDIMLIKDHKHN